MPLKDQNDRRAYERKRKRLKRLEKINSLNEPDRTIALSRLRGPYKINYATRIYW